MIIKILSFKSVPEDVLTYFLDRDDLRKAWQRVIHALPLEPRANGRVTDLQEAVDLVMKALRKTLERELALKSNVKLKDLSDEEFLKVYVKWISQASVSQKRK